MKIVIDARELRTSTGRYVERLLYYLQQIDIEHDYQILLKPADLPGWEATNNHFQKVACPHKEFTFDEQIGFKKQLDQLQPDLVHFAMVQQPVFYKGRVVTTMHDLTTLRFKNPSKNPVIFKAKQEVYGWVNKQAVIKSQAIITPTSFVKNDIIKTLHADPKKITIINEAADPITDTPTVVPQVDQKRFLLYVGRPTPHKNLKRLLEAFQILVQKDSSLYLVLAGKTDANYQKLQRYTTSRSVPNVIYTGFINDGQLRWLYEHCAAYVFPSLSEGFGLPGLEAMQHGAPVVSSNATCLPEVYGDAAQYFNPLDVSDIATNITAVITNQALQKQLITKGKAQVKLYSWEEMARKTLDVYVAALKRPASV